MASDNRFAVLIDADNVSVKYIKIILDEISKDGIATYKRIYGDWTNPSLISWKSTLLDNSIIPVQQYSYTTGKNSTDSAMIIDAMDILYSGRVEGFCLVSSDSDFTRLAARLRESGMTVIGMGESKTPNSFIAACNKFKYLDILSAADEAEAEEAAPKAEPAKKPAAQPKKDRPEGRRQKAQRGAQGREGAKARRAQKAAGEGHRGAPHQPAHHPPGAAHHCAGELRRGQLDHGQPGGQPAGQALHGL